MSTMLVPRTGRRVAVAMLLLRIIVGAAFIIHGSAKIKDPLHWLDEGPLLGIPAWLQLIVAFAEYYGGMLLIAGLLTPLVAFLLACDMGTIILFVKLPHGRCFVGCRGSYELEMLFFVVMLVFLLIGPGTFSIDAWLAQRRRSRRDAS